MLSKLLLALPFLLQTAAVQNPAASNLPPIKMGLWEASITSSTSTPMKTRSCMTQQSYQQQMAHVPAGCTLTNLSRGSANMSGDVSCKSPNGAQGSGHFDAEFPDTSTINSTISITVNMQGRSMPITVKTQSHYIGPDCGDIKPGAAQIVH